MTKTLHSEATGYNLSLLNDLIALGGVSIGGAAKIGSLGGVLYGVGGTVNALAFGTARQQLRMVGGTALQFFTNPAVLAYNSGNFSLAISGTTYSITLDSERFDSEAMHDVSSATTRLTCVTPGRYWIWGNVAFASNATGVRAVQVVWNNTSAVGQTIVQAVNGDVTIAGAGGFWDMAANDYVELRAVQTSGGALNAQAVNGFPSFGMTRVG